MSDQWWLLKTSSGVLSQVVTDGRNPSACGTDTTGLTVTMMPRRGDLLVEMPNSAGTAWVDNLPAIDALLVGQLNQRREMLQMQAMTDGGAKKTVYAAKRLEVDNWNRLGATATAIMTAFNLLDLTTRKQKFQYSMAEAALTGDTMAVVIARFASGADTSTAYVAKIEAISQMAVAAVKAATTGAAKRAAYAAVTWSTT